MKYALAIALSVSLASGSAFAASEKKPAEAASDGKDKQICEVFTELGSRLSRKKLCMTASQWADHKRQTRQTMDKAQASRASEPNN